MNAVAEINNRVFEAPLTLPEERKAMASLFGSLVQAVAKVQAVEKDSRNTYHKYAYASAESILVEGRTALSTHGLCIIPLESLIISDGSQGHILRCHYMLGHKDGASFMLKKDWPIVPERGRPFDKATASADTTSLAYLYRDLLQMPRVDSSDDMDHPSRDQLQSTTAEEPPEHEPPRQPVDEFPAWRQRCKECPEDKLVAALAAIEKTLFTPAQKAELRGVIEERKEAAGQLMARPPVVKDTLDKLAEMTVYGGNGRLAMRTRQAWLEEFIEECRIYQVNEAPYMETVSKAWTEAAVRAIHAFLDTVDVARVFKDFRQKHELVENQELYARVAEKIAETKARLKIRE